jgi:carboxyl-terminal processing protease
VGLFEERPFVEAVEPDSEAAGMGVKPGAEIVEVDGVAVEEKLARLRMYLPGRSSERAFRREACRYLLAGEKGSTVSVHLRSPDRRTNDTLTLKRSFGLGRPGTRNCPFELTPQRFVHFGRHPSGLGYIQIVSLNGRAEVVEEFDRALEALRATRGLILDIRDNEGGFGQPRIAGRLLQQSALVAVSYRKNGPGHKDLQRREERLEPSGPWQYTGPVALLVNDVTGSAADLFACWLRSAGRVVTIGSTTHGNLSGVAAFAVLPCGLVVRISNGYMCDAKDQPIEGQGNEPDVRVSPTIADVLNGKDPVLDRAVSLLGAPDHPN